MADKPKDKFWGGANLRELKLLVNQLEKDSVRHDFDLARLDAAIKAGSLKSVVSAIKENTLAIIRVAAALEKNALDQATLNKAGVGIRANTKGIREAMKDETKTR